ncbi:SPFH domain-containing protein [Sulfurimonas sp.]|jgi:regulator of protease activity HflC (stomatin/prohibitin superfamily)|uniref:SPFH domain-containing protein n=1 Tax=Sulfurimonas sp. TaxID=2022749 RepID=UPI0025D34C4F|nr:SPFH domain-containing protein [Sulfurimonas sp.]MBT5933927.1 hypothetical protein [Sulfurimonas sp.]
MKQLFKTLGWTFGIAFLAVIALAFMAVTKTGFAIVNDGERGVKKSGTTYDMTEMNPGYHFFIPIYTTVDVKTIRPKLINYSVSEAHKEDSELLIFEPVLKGLDKKGIPIKLALSIEVAPVAEQLAEMYKSDGDFDNSFYKKVLQVNRDAVQSTISRFSVDSIMDNRSAVEKTLTDLLNKSYAENPYFQLVNINLKDIIVPQKIRDKQEEVQVAKQEALKSKELIVKAENEAKSVEAAALGTANAVKITAQGEADAILLKATAQAKANELVSKSLTRQILKNNAILKWDGVKSKVQAGNSGMIIDLGDISK